MAARINASFTGGRARWRSAPVSPSCQGSNTARSSAGQSDALRTRRSGVRILPGRQNTRSNEALKGCRSSALFLFACGAHLGLHRTWGVFVSTEEQDASSEEATLAWRITSQKYAEKPSTEKARGATADTGTARVCQCRSRWVAALAALEQLVHRSSQKVFPDETHEPTEKGSGQTSRLERALGRLEPASRKFPHPAAPGALRTRGGWPSRSPTPIIGGSQSGSSASTISPYRQALNHHRRLKPPNISAATSEIADTYIGLASGSWTSRCGAV